MTKSVKPLHRLVLTSAYKVTPAGRWVGGSTYKGVGERDIYPGWVGCYIPRVGIVGSWEARMGLFLT